MDEKYMEMASALTEAETNSGRAKCAKAAIPTEDLEPEKYKSLVCIECDDGLPLFRVKKGLVLCVPCQSAIDRRKKL